MKTKITNEPYAADVQQLARRNSDFRRVLNTTERSQLVLMCVPAGGEIGKEIHAGTDQILAFVEGNGEAIFADERRFRIRALRLTRRFSWTSHVRLRILHRGGAVAEATVFRSQRPPQQDFAV